MPSPQDEAGDFEIVIKAHRHPAARGLHHGEAHGVRVAEALVLQFFEPGQSAAMVRLGRKLDAHQAARLDPAQRVTGGLDARPEQQEPVTGVTWIMISRRRRRQTRICPSRGDA